MANKNDIGLIRAPHQAISYTPEQLKEFMRCADSVSGPLYFLSNYFHVQHPTRGKMLYKPYPYQVELIRVYHEYRNSISLLSRQLGKSVTACGYLLWYAMFKSDSTILIAAHKYSGVQELMQRIRYAYELCPDHLRAGVISYNKHSIEFDNGSRIVGQATTENTGRGMSVTVLYCDELAFVRPTIAREFFASISPTLSTGGKAMITSTPNSDEDQFALIWKEACKTEDEFGNTTEVGVNGFKAYSVDWRAHPDRNQEWADQERAKIGDERFKREHENCFVINDETLITPTRLAELEPVEPKYTVGQVRWYQTPNEDSIFAVALDPSLGTGGDYAAIQVFDVSNATQIAEWKHNKTPIAVQIRTMVEILRHLLEHTDDPNSIYYTIENNSIGEAAIMSWNDYGEENIPGIMLSDRGKGRTGFTTTNKNKLIACSKLKMLIDNKRMTILSKPLVSELKSFVASGASYAAKPGATDDLVMATVLVVRIMQHLRDYYSDVSGQLSDHSDEIIEPLPFVAYYG